MASSWVPVATAAVDGLVKLFSKKKDGEARRQINEARQAADDARRAAAEMKQQADDLASQVANYQREQQELLDRLEKEMEERAEQDERHQAALQQMQAESEAARAQHREELKAFRKEALRSEKNLLEARLTDLRKDRRRLDREYQKKFSTLEELALQVKSESDKMQHFTPELSDPNIKRIVLLGLTGDGKSTLANRLVGDGSEDGDEGPFKTSDGTQSETQAVVKVLCDRFGVKISVVDTPGIADSGGYGRDRQHITNLVEYLRGCGGVNQFLIIKNQSNPRLSSTYQGMLRELEHALGREFWRFVTVVLTHVEGRRALRDFEKHKQELCEQIASLFGINGLDGIGIGMDDYEEVISDIVTRVVPQDKFICDKLVSPLEELKAQQQALEEEVVTEKQNLSVADATIQQVEGSLRDVEEKLTQL